MKKNRIKLLHFKKVTKYIYSSIKKLQFRVKSTKNFIHWKNGREIKND